MTEILSTSTPLRVVIACDTFPPDINGASRFAERLASGLVRDGHEVHVIAPAHNKTFGSFTEVHDGSSMTVHRIKSYRVIQHKTLRYVWPFTLKKKADRLLRAIKPQAVHINSHMIVGRFVLKSAQELGIRVIATNHIMPENLIKYSLVIPRWAEKWVMDLAWKDAGRVLRKADVVTTPTRRAATLLEEASGLTGVLAISCGIEASKFANRTPTSNKEPRILFLGRLDYEKHIHNLRIFRTTTDNGATSGERNGTKVLHVPAQREIVSIARHILREAYTTRCPNENAAFEREIDASSIGSEVEAKRQTGSISKTLVDTTRFFESRTTLSTACSNFWTVLKERHSKEPRTKSIFDEI